MLEAMTTQAADYLFQHIQHGAPECDTQTWYRRLKAQSPELVFPYLVESVGQIEHVYIIERQGSQVRLTVTDMKPELIEALPFVKPSGSQSAQVGPVIKRSYDRQKGAGPSQKILNTTMREFQRLAYSNDPWSDYFAQILSVLSAEKITLATGEECEWKTAGYESLLECVVKAIGPAQGTALITVKTPEGKLPGQVSRYMEYLMTEILAGGRYLTGKIEPVPSAQCPLCSQEETTVYPNALKGAGINLTNMDRSGRFPGLTLNNAWKNHPLCVDCADLLYIYKNSVIQKRKKDSPRPYTAPVAGERALIIPYCVSDAKLRFEVWESVKDFIQEAQSNVELSEDDLLDILKEQKGLLNLTFLWCSIGQSLEDVTGFLTDVPPSRLRFLSSFNFETRDWNHLLFPKKILHTEKWKLKADLSLSAFRSLFYRPGGRPAPKDSRRLSELKHWLAAAVYHDRPLFSRHQARLWEEILITAQWWWFDALKSGSAYGLLNQGIGTKGKEDSLTTAGWIRHWAWWLFYFQQLGVMDMRDSFYEPEMKELKPYFGPESGIDSEEKAYAFLLGTLYGKLLEMQGARGVNVSSNALTWLKRLRLKGFDLPELYIKTREKMLSYEGEKSEKIRKVIHEIGRIGIRLGDPIDLSQIQTNYYLLLGQSMTKDIFAKEDNKS